MVEYVLSIGTSVRKLWYMLSARSDCSALSIWETYLGNVRLSFSTVDYVPAKQQHLQQYLGNVFGPWSFFIYEHKIVPRSWTFALLGSKALGR